MNPKDHRYALVASRKKLRALTAQRQTPDAAGGPVALRHRLLTLAGVDEQQQANLVRRSIERLSSLLDARRTQRLVVPIGQNQGSRVEEFEEPDYREQRQAAEALLSVLGVQPSRSASAGSPTQVAVVVQIDPMQATAAKGPEIKVISPGPEAQSPEPDSASSAQRGTRSRSAGTEGHKA
jgi:hypothetical protein